MRIVGMILIFVALVFTCWWLLGDREYKGWAVSICLIAVFVGAFFILNERITELKIFSIGQLRMAAKQAEADADAISRLREQIETQAETTQKLRAAVEGGAVQVAKALEYIRSLQDEVARTSDKVEDLHERLAESPTSSRPQLQYGESTFRKIDSHVSGHIVFRSTSNISLTSVDFQVSVVGSGESRILSIEPAVPVSLMVSTFVSPDGRQASLRYTVVGDQEPAFSLELTAPTRIRIEGQPGIRPFELDANGSDGEDA